jgi:acyl-coenzyme A thioesterase PaaI-like protein
MQPFPTFPRCPVCGDPGVNPGALAVRWYWDQDRSCVVGSFTPTDVHTGYAGRMHGGLVSSLLDEAMAWACAVEKRAYCVTGELSVRFKTAAALGDALRVDARVAGKGWGPYVKAEAELRSSTGELHASARATFAALGREESLAMRDALVLAPGDLDVLADAG